MANPNREFQLVEINLLPSEFRRTKLDLSWLSDIRVIWSTFAVIVVGLILLLLYYHVRDTIADLEKAVQQTKQAVERERPLLQKIKELDDKLQVIKQKSEALRSIQVSRKRWVLLFEDLFTALPSETWIVGINQSSSKMQISCRSWTFADVALYMIELGKKESITGVSLTAINATKISGDDAYDFSIEVGFNPNLGLEEGIR
jgi:type IV pilus assembly protein PilN